MSIDYHANKQRNTMALSCVNEMNRILEIPNLVERCIKSGNWSEALDLDDCTRHMVRQNHDLEIVSRVIRKRTEQLICQSLLTRSSTFSELTNGHSSSAVGGQTTTTHLLEKLSSKECNKVPMCLKIVSHIRRLQLCRSERELRTLFLQCRLSHVQSRLLNVEKEFEKRIMSSHASMMMMRSMTKNNASTSMTTTTMMTNANRMGGQQEKNHLLNMIAMMMKMDNNNSSIGNSSISTIMNVNNESLAYEFLSQLTDTLKVESFNMISQYHAVFPNKSSSSLSSLLSSASLDNVATPTSATSTTSSTSFSSVMSGGGMGGSSSASGGSLSQMLDDSNDDILPSCILHLIEPYLQTLSSFLFYGLSMDDDSKTTKPKHYGNPLSGEQVAKLLETCMYTGATLSRVGADFRVLMASMFTKRVTTEWTFRLRLALEQFQSRMQQYDLNAQAHKSNLHQHGSSTTSTPLSPQDEQVHSTSSDSHNNPPRILLQHEPLAELLNAVLTALNELRQCCPVSITKTVMHSMRDDLLLPLYEHLMVFRDDKTREWNKSTTTDSKELTIFKNLCKCVCREFTNHLVQCMQKLFVGTDAGGTIVPREQWNKLNQQATHVPVVVSSAPATTTTITPTTPNTDPLLNKQPQSDQPPQQSPSKTHE